MIPVNQLHHKLIILLFLFDSLFFLYLIIIISPNRPSIYFKLSHYGTLPAKSTLALNPLSSFQLGKGLNLNSPQGEKEASMGGKTLIYFSLK